jgi:PBP1b-binding outer membrane lipoprotein LpoB
MRPSLAAVAILLLPATLALTTGCGGTTVTRVDEKTDVDLSGNWNAGDSRRVSEKLIAQALQSPWADDYKRINNRLPVVKIGRIKVITNGDVVNTDIFANDLVRALINSGKVEAVASNSEVEEARQERKDQDVNASEKTRKESFQETGTDYLIIGAINVQDDQAGGKHHKYYSTDLKLIDVKTQKMVCPMNEKISKIVER